MLPKVATQPQLSEDVFGIQETYGYTQLPANESYTAQAALESLTWIGLKIEDIERLQT